MDVPRVNDACAAVSRPSVDAAVRSLQAWLARGGAAQYIGEDISIAAHLCQVSDCMAAETGGAAWARVVGFVHDIGHMDGEAGEMWGVVNGHRCVVGRENHEEKGARQLEVREEDAEWRAGLIGRRTSLLCTKYSALS
jgi:predicted HD phosphohydrolase